MEEVITHASQNIGDNDPHGIRVELKRAPAAGTPPAAPGGFLLAVTFIDGIPGESALERRLLDLAGPARSQPGNLEYDLYRLLDEKIRFVRLGR